MPIYKPKELFEFLQYLGIHPKKSLSQNFLIDANILRKIVSVSRAQVGDVVLEIGPGPGCLTELLLDQGMRVLAVEKDDLLGKSLARLQTPKNHLTVLIDDILNVPLETTLKPFLLEKKAKVLANLPYHLTSLILARLVPLHAIFDSLTIMVQEEVARRMTAKPRTKEYSSFTVFLRFFSEPHYEFKVSRNCFYPKPKVDSAIVSLKLHPPAHVSNQERFFEMTRMAFTHRRKMLRSSLKELYLPVLIENTLKEMGHRSEARPEELSLEEFLFLFEAFNSPPVSE